MNFYKMEYTEGSFDYDKGQSHYAYMLVDNGMVVKYMTLDGQDLTLPEKHECRIVDAKAPTPDWYKE